MTPKKNEKNKKTKKSMCGALLPSKTSGVERSSPFQSGGWCPLFFFSSHTTESSSFSSSSSSFILSNNDSRKTVVNFRKRGEHPLARGEESRISGADVCVARAVEQFRCAFFFLRGRAQGKRERKKDAGIARCRRLIF